MEGEVLTEKEQQAFRFLRNALVHDGVSPSIRDLARALGYKSPRTAFLLLGAIINKGWLVRRPDGSLQVRKDLPASRDRATTIPVPLIGAVACGTPLLAEENVEAFIPVSSMIAKPGARYFFLRAQGDSMNAAGIQNGDLILVRQQQQAENGQHVVALIDDVATVKELRRERDLVILNPRSSNMAHKPIILTEDFLIQGVVVATVPFNRQQP